MAKDKIFTKLFSKKNIDEDPLLSCIFKKYVKKINDYGKKMISNIIQISDITVKEIMIPRIDVTSIEINSNIQEIIKLINEKGYSRLPVYDKNIDNIVGILHTKDIFKYFNKESNFDIQKLIRVPIFVPESKMINDLLLEFRERKNHLAIVVDEYGGMAGIVCLEDIIEKIVGEIQDEFDNEVDDIQKIDDNIFLVNPRISLEKLNERLNTDFHEEEIDTLGGIIFMLFGKIPAKNEKIHYKNYILTVESISARKIKSVKIEILNKKKET